MAFLDKAIQGIYFFSALIDSISSLVSIFQIASSRKYEFPNIAINE